MGMQQRLHPCLSNITTNQFISDIVWLYGSLQQSLTGRGRNIVMEYETSQDGILTYRKFIATYRYDGNVSVYIASQQAILKVEFTLDYPGGMLKFVEGYETAFMNIDYVLRDHPILEDDGIPMQGFYTDAGKRQTFVQNFSLNDATITMIESVEATTSTWQEMVDALQQRLAKRVNHNRRAAKHLAHHAQVNALQQHQISPSPVQAAQAFLANATSSNIDVFVNTMMQVWRVGSKLWSSLNHEMKSSIMDARHEAMNADHRGGPNDKT